MLQNRDESLFISEMLISRRGSVNYSSVHILPTKPLLRIAAFMLTVIMTYLLGQKVHTQT